MANKKCFLENCAATVGDCEKAKCPCLKCLGKNKENCEILQSEHKSKIQTIICSRCKNFVLQK